MLVVDGRPVAGVRVASSGPDRRRGLLGTASLEGALWIERCSSVHCVGMAYPIDVAHVDRRGRVLAVVTMRPGAVGRPRLRGRSVVEAEAGRMAAWGVRRGSAVAVAPVAPATPAT